MRGLPIARFVLVVVILAYGLPANAQRADLARNAAAAGAAASSFDDDGVPQFLRAVADLPGPAGASPEAAALSHLARFVSAFGVRAEDVAAAEVVQVQAIGSGVLVQLTQRVAGIDVFRSDVKVFMRSDQSLIAISGRPRSIAEAGGRRAVFAISPQAALAAALSDRFGAAIDPTSVTSAASGDPAASRAQRFQLGAGTGLYMSEPAAVTPVLLPEAGTLVASYTIDFYAGPPDAGDAVANRYIIAADTGQILERRDLTVSEQQGGEPNGVRFPAFDYRVFADPSSKRPLDNPQEEYSPSPTSSPDGFQPPYILPDLVSVSGLNRQPSAIADPWLAGTATETNGNNADAYADHRAPDGLTPGLDFRADVTSARTFDRTYDTSLEPVASANQSKAAIANAFYTVNWLHDYWYDSGFTEAAANAQHDNYGRGGVGGDAMRVEVQDNFFGGARNNANMSTPSDGIRPRMQMYVWTGEQNASLTLTPGGTLTVGTAAFGPANFDLTAPVVLANDGGGVTTDACGPLTTPATGSIVLVDRGTCAFTDKAINVQNAGGVGMIVANNAPGAAPGMGGTNPAVVIPVLSISLPDGTALKASLAAGPVSARMYRLTATSLDSALDNTVIAHEWGHYFHHRLSDCGTTQCAALSEGWGDFLALHTMARAGDNLHGTYAAAAYAGRGLEPNSQYLGIRRVPYSVNFDHDPLTFRHISNAEPLPPGVVGGPNAEVHNAGEIWATALWEAYVALHDAARPGQTFDAVRRRMADHLVGGLLLAPRDATFTETRDAILAAAVAARPDNDAADPDDGGAGGADVLVLANAFARRGLGTCAVSAPRASTNFIGVVESFEVKPQIVVGDLRIVEDRSCDNDGFLDAGERGQVLVTVLNGGPVEMLDTTVSLSSALSGLAFPKGNSVTIARLAPFSQSQIAIDIALDSSFSGIGELQIDVTLTNAAACETTLTDSLTAYVNVDSVPASSSTDTVESPSTVWTTGGLPADIWSRVEVAPFEHAWVGIDFGGVSDTLLISPALEVGTGALVVTLSHRHSFELSDERYDGGVIEVSTDGGATWQDVTGLAVGANLGTLFTGSGNPLSGRLAFVGQNASWPARDALTLDFGTTYAGQTIRLRFRIGTDAGVGDYGWELDNLEFQGITNTPFASLVGDQTVCRLR